MIMPIEFDALVAVYPVLRDVPFHLRRMVQDDAQPVSLPAGHMLFDVDSPCRAFLWLVSGTIRVTRPLGSGREILLYRVQPGESCILTVSCLLGDAAYPARGVIESDAHGAALSRDHFIRLIEQSPPVRQFIFRFFGERLARLLELIEQVAFRRLDQRLAALLLANSGSVEATHQKLADELGSVREVVSRILEDFQEQRIVQLERGQIRILDRVALERRAHSAT